MRKVDFLSQSPNAFIFQKESNKTTFGGVLSVIYLIIAFFIYEYISMIFGLNGNYEITSFVSEERIIDESEQGLFDESKKYNPILPMKFTLIDEYGKELSDRFIIVNYWRNKTIERNKIINKRVNDIHFDILYKCDEKNDTNKTYCDIDDKDMSTFFSLVIKYQGFYYKPQDKIPIKQLPNDMFHSYSIGFNPDIKLKKFIRWTITRYEDNNGFSKIIDIIKGNLSEIIKNNIRENNIFIGGEFEDYDTMIISKYSSYKPIKNTKLLFIFDSLTLKNRNTVLYKDYKRKEESLLECFAKDFSLWISLYKVFVFLFSKLY